MSFRSLPFPIKISDLFYLTLSLIRLLPAHRGSTIPTTASGGQRTSSLNDMEPIFLASTGPGTPLIGPVSLAAEAHPVRMIRYRASTTRLTNSILLTS